MKRDSVINQERISNYRNRVAFFIKDVRNLNLLFYLFKQMVQSDIEGARNDEIT
jgi:hypothetical protein